MQMNNLPNGWMKATLGQVGEVSMCKRIMKHQTNGVSGVPFFKIGTFGGVADAYIDKNLFAEYKTKYSYPKVGEVLLSAAGTIGRLVVFDGNDAYFQDSNIVWVANDEKLVLNKYLYYLYCTIKWRTSEGGIVSRLYNNEIRKTVIVIPPINEQEKIAEILGTWDRAIEELTDLIAEKKELKRGLMQRLLTATQRLPGFAKPWKKIKLHDVAEISKGTQLNRLNMLEEGFPVYNGGMTESGFTNEYNNDAYTIIISEGGNSCGFVNFIKTKFWAGGHCYTVICHDCVNKSFLYQLLKYNENKLMNLRVGSGLPNIQQKALNKFSLLLPDDFTEQKAIADVLSKADSEIDLLNQQLDLLKEQKRGLMQKLLTGEIRVKVDME